jgi:hypothetical protein
MWHRHLACAGWKPAPQIKSDCYILTHLLIFAYFIQETGIDTNPGAKLPLMVYGRAEKPYVDRNLLPTTVRIITKIIR